MPWGEHTFSTLPIWKLPDIENHTLIKEWVCLKNYDSWQSGNRQENQFNYKWDIFQMNKDNCKLPDESYKQIIFSKQFLCYRNKSKWDITLLSEKPKQVMQWKVIME